MTDETESTRLYIKCNHVIQKGFIFKLKWSRKNTTVCGYAQMRDYSFDHHQPEHLNETMGNCVVGGFVPFVGSLMAKRY